jgi:hypothetical protein
MFSKLSGSLAPSLKPGAAALSGADLLPGCLSRAVCGWSTGFQVLAHEESPTRDVRTLLKSVLRQRWCVMQPTNSMGRHHSESSRTRAAVAALVWCAVEIGGRTYGSGVDGVGAD